MIQGPATAILLSLLAHSGTAVAQSSVQPAAVTSAGIPSNFSGPPPEIHFCDGAAQESKDWSLPRSNSIRLLGTVRTQRG
jgi:hypothetical protein